MSWYHKNLQHCSKEIMQQTIGTNFCWLGLTTQMVQCMKRCILCQEYKITDQKSYGKVLIQEDKEDIELWSSVHLDMARAWKVRIRHKKHRKIYSVKVQMMTAVDQGSSFPEIWEMKKKESRYAAQTFDMNWLC
eukprot:6264148-Ditylum_brightwellii.AAC.1